MKIVIRAGGLGTRLWPCSTSRMPKQFLPMFEGRSCARLAYERFAGSGLARRDEIYVSVGKDHAGIVRRQFPDVPAANVIVEPSRQDTGAAIGLETAWIARIDPEAVIASLGSDHYVAKPDVFVSVLRAAEAFLSEHPEYLVAVACEPKRPETNYGHVKKGRVLGRYDDVPVHQADGFTEKPDLERAIQMTESGQYLWNANFFVWRADTILDLFRECKPEMYEKLAEIQRALGTPAAAEVLGRVYPTLEKVAVDYAIMEPAGRERRIAVIPADMGWSDIGSWATLTDAFPADADGNLSVGGRVISLGTRDTTVYIDNPGRRIVAVLDVEGLAVIDTPEALLVVPKARAGRVKDLVQALRDSPDTSGLV